MVSYYQRLRERDNKMRERVIDNVDFDYVSYRFNEVIMEGHSLLINIKMCSREDSIRLRLHQLNRLDDDAMMLIEFAESMANRFSWRQKKVAIMRKRYERTFVENRDAVVFSK